MTNGTSALFQQVIPQQQLHAAPSLPAVSQTQQQSIASLAQSQTSSTANISSYSHQPAQALSQQQPSLASHHAQHQQQQQQQQSPLHAPQHQQHYVQHSLPTHVDTAPTAQQPHSAQSPQAQPQQNAAHSSFFRQQEAPYFHAPTPPVSASQSQDSPYGSFGQLSGQLGGNQIAHQTQASHLSGFGQGEYGYDNNQRVSACK